MVRPGTLRRQNGFVDACRELGRSSGSFRSREAAAEAAFNTGECMGFIKGVLATTHGHLSTARYCIPAEALMGQIMRVVVQYVDARPARSEPFAVLVDEAIQAAWPCKR
jgi:hypothetical protein